MKKNLCKLILGIVLPVTLGIVGTGCQAGIVQSNTDNSFPFVEVSKFDEINFKELSGLVYHPTRKTLFAVGDKGYITELQTDGTVITQKKVRKGADFEGITCHLRTGNLYVVVEGDDTILEVNPEVLEVTREIPLNRQFNNQVLLDPEGNGIEGITFYSYDETTQTSTFYLVNQSKELEGSDPSIVLEVQIKDTGNEPAQIIRYFSLGITGLSGIHYNPVVQQLFVISDNKDTLIEVTPRGQISNMYPLPGSDQEGITFDADGFLYIAQDSEEGVLKFKPLP